MHVTHKNLLIDVNVCYSVNISTVYVTVMSDRRQHLATFSP